MNLKFALLEQHYKILELLFDSVHHVYWKGTDGIYQGCNAAQNRAFKTGTIAGKTLFELVPDQLVLAKDIDEVDRYVMGKKSAINLEEELTFANGERYCISQKNPICNVDGKVIGMIGFSIDITQRKRQEIRFKHETDKLLMHTAQAAHDLRSPVASLLMLIKSVGEIPEQDRTSLMQAAHTIQKLADSMLDQHQPKLNVDASY